jgi:hypothetical protein
LRPSRWSTCWLAWSDSHPFGTLPSFVTNRLRFVDRGRINMRSRCTGAVARAGPDRRVESIKIQIKRGVPIMWWTAERANAVTGGIWLVGLGVLFATGDWWPGILFLVGVTAIVEGSARGAGWQSIHGGLWLLLFACWALMDFNFAVLFVAAGVYAIIAALAKPSPFQKPYVDQTLE